MFYKGKDIRLNQLKTPTKKVNGKRGRLDYLNDFLKANKKDKRLVLKQYYFSKLKDGSDIFQKAAECWESRKIKVYHVDGLIFVPIKEHYPLHSGAWYSLFKWKPAYLNSIDFLVKTLKDENGNEYAYHIKCFERIVQDIKNFDKIAITKYNYEPLYGGKTKKQIEEGHDIVITFD